MVKTVSNGVVSKPPILERQPVDTKYYLQVMKEADKDKNGHLTRNELQKFIDGYKKPDKGDTKPDFTRMAASDMLSHFNQIAGNRGSVDRAGSDIWTMDYRQNDNTIETADIKAQAKVDGDGSSISTKDYPAGVAEPPILKPLNKPPVTNEVPPDTNEDPVVTDPAPPVTNEVPPDTNEDPVVKDEVPPTGNANDEITTLIQTFLQKLMEMFGEKAKAA